MIFLEQAFEIIITKLEPPPDRDPSPEEEQTEITNDDLQIVVPDMPQWAAKEDVSPVEEEHFDNVPGENVVPQPYEEPVEVEPAKEVEDEPASKEVPKKSEVEEPKPQTHQVKFSESLVLTSFKSPSPKEERKEQAIKPILKPAVSKTESPPPKREEPKVSLPPQKRAAPVLEQKVVAKPPLRVVKPPPVVPVVEDVRAEEKKEKQPEEEAKAAEERTEEPPKLEPEV